ncbi:hypothetical protein SAMN05216259_108254 [Actinacidiphila guanduensis]|jgi:hypothetical protein|uniref:Uncharacterized protein n=1 Tax=Actinacidiphila guanduensis TaxID=310781 RepID=A0A1H0HY12_9ACTN|nr:hypothetical protein SAMN05216259_108254 [Actinacidiphila guanduensis]
MSCPNADCRRGGCSTEPQQPRPSGEGRKA